MLITIPLVKCSRFLDGRLDEPAIIIKSYITICTYFLLFHSILITVKRNSDYAVEHTHIIENIYCIAYNQFNRLHKKNPIQKYEFQIGLDGITTIKIFPI